MLTLWQDIRFGIRMLLKQPGFTAIALITLALGIGANSAIFSAVNAVLLKPLPFKDQDRITMVWAKGEEAAGGDYTPLSMADVLDWRAQNKSFESIAACSYARLNYIGGKTPEQVISANVTDNFFSTIGIKPFIGRDFLPEEGRPGSKPVVIISDAFWRNYLSSDPNVVGRAITLNDDNKSERVTIIGVLSAKLNFPFRNTEIWRSLPIQTPIMRGPYFLRGVARLKPGISVTQAYSNTKLIKSSFENRNINFNIVPIRDHILRDMRPSLIALFIAATLVLLIATANISNLMLARSTTRKTEISLRLALGATKWRITRQLITESLILALIGGTIGIFAAMWGIEIILKVTPSNLSQIEQIGIDKMVLGWTLIISIISGVLFGLAPVWKNSNINENLKYGIRNIHNTDRRSHYLIVIGETTLAIALLIGSGLMIKSLLHLQRVNIGIDSARIATSMIILNGEKYSDPQSQRNFYKQLIERVKVLPGVNSAAVSNSLPPSSTDYSDYFSIEGRLETTNQPPPVAYMIHISHDYFRTLGIALREGRYFNANDESVNAPKVVLVNEITARTFFPNQSPIDKRVNLGNATNPIWHKIIGVVSDVKYNGLASKTQPALYRVMEQTPTGGAMLIIKSDTTDPLSLIPSIRNEVKLIDSELPLAQVGMLEDQIDEQFSNPRFRTILIGLFGLLALILTSIGIYGVIAYSVAQRMHEIGIRIALGAHRKDVLKLVVNQGITPAAIGIVIGLIASFALTRLMKSLLFEVSATDPMTFVVIPIMLIMVSLIACLIPARRATKIDPIAVLRCD